MTGFLGLDLSKRSAGWAFWSPRLSVPLSGAWQLGSEYTNQGETFLKLHQRMNDLYMIEPFDNVRFEAPLNLGPAAGNTTAETIEVLMGLAAHVRSYCAAKGIRHCNDVNMVSWRRHFIGPMKRGTKSVDLKEYAMQRCREYGLKPAVHDEAEAIGVLSFAMNVAGVTAPWETVLRAPLGKMA